VGCGCHQIIKLKDAYATAVASRKKEFHFDGYDFLVDYAKHLIEDLEDHFEKSKKTKPVYRFSGNS
jgi:hypothetical protein